jgi:hypothetical protein
MLRPYQLHNLKMDSGLQGFRIPKRLMIERGLLVSIRVKGRKIVLSCMVFEHCH